MKELIINRELSLSCPEGFHEMDQEELKKVYLDDNPNRMGIWDTEKHIIASVWWHTSGSLLARLAGNAQSVAKTTEGKIRKAYKHYDYVFNGFFPAEIGGSPAYGFRYDYTLNGIVQSSETIVLMHGNCCYTFYFYARKENEQESRAVMDDILGSVRFI